MRLSHLLSIVFIAIFSSCVSMSNGLVHPPFDNYQPNEYKYIKSVYGVSTENYVFGIGGDYKSLGLRANALNEMKKRHKLSDNQMFINITVDKKNTFFVIPIIWMQTKYVITADVIEFK